jgi:probable phosphoglycerate mutase
LRVLYDEAKDLIQSFDSVTLEHVPRAQNSHADRLCNEALDGAKSKSASPSPRPGKAKRKLAQEQAMREDALRWLNWAAGQWARGNPSDPPPADVWDHLWTILEDHGAVRPKP